MDAKQNVAPPGKRYIVPGDGMTIPHPDDGKPIGAEGAWVPNNRFYRNFIRRGEAKEGPPPKPEKAETTAKPTDNPKEKD